MDFKKPTNRQRNNNSINSFKREIVSLKSRECLLLVNKWTIGQDEMNLYCAEDVRDLLIRCFLHAHLDEVAERKKNAYSRVDYTTAKRSIIAEIRLSFKQVNGDFDSPTRDSLKNVVHLLADKQI